jgi:hypothetical protein
VLPLLSIAVPVVETAETANTMKFAPVVFMAPVVTVVVFADTAEVCAIRLAAPNNGAATHSISMATIREVSFIRLYLSLDPLWRLGAHSLLARRRSSTSALVTMLKSTSIELMKADHPHFC